MEEPETRNGKKLSPMPVCLPTPPWQRDLSGAQGSLPRGCVTSGDGHGLACGTGCLLDVDWRKA